MDPQVLMIAGMLDISTRGYDHEEDATFLKGKAYKYVMHTV